VVDPVPQRVRAGCEKLPKPGWWGIEGENSPNLRVEHSDIIGGNLTNSGILGSGTFVGNDIQHVSIGIQLTDGASTLSSNYIHDLFYGNGDPHYDGVTLLGGQNHVVVDHNTISVPQQRGTASILIANIADSDYVAASNTLHFGANENTKTISVTINGDTKSRVKRDL
jgi:pectate lyase